MSGIKNVITLRVFKITKTIMKKFITFIVSLAAFSFAANAASYEVNDASIDSIFEEAELVVEAPAALPALDATGRKVVTIICNIFLGWAAIHRVVLGTNNLNILWYILTVGGIFGIIPLVDLIMYIIDIAQGGGSKYMGNPKFIMWA